MKKEWFRLTDPVYKAKRKSENNGTEARRRKESAYTELRDAVQALVTYTATLNGHSNQELKQLAKAIRTLISGPD